MIMIKVKLISYDIDMTKSQEKEAYLKIKAHCKNLGYKVFKVANKSLLQSGEYKIDTNVLFSNQFNTVKTSEHDGYRLFSWLEQYSQNKNIKRGYYLDNVEALQDLMRTTYECGFCKAQYKEDEAKEVKFCTKCRGSELLAPENYELLKLTKIGDKRQKESLPTYIIEDILSQQQLRAKKDLEKNNLRRINRLLENINSTTAELRRFSLLSSLGISLENVIYYSHIDTVCFGWIDPIKDSTELIEKLKTFPYEYKIKNYLKK